MKVYGIEITQAQIDACIARMKTEPFQANHLVHVALEAGVFPTVASRMVDRLIQQQRVSGRIGLAGGREWRWIAP